MNLSGSGSRSDGDNIPAPVRSCVSCYCPQKEVKRCGCGLWLLVQTSKTVKNPLRRFYKCERGTVEQGGCGYWDWTDDGVWICPHLMTYVMELMNEKDALKKKLGDEMKLFEAGENKVDVLEGENKVLKGEVKNQKEIILKLKMKLMIMVTIIFCFFAVFAGLLMV